MFTVKGKLFSLHDRRVLVDAVGNPLVTFQQKLLTSHRRWQVFRGESTDSSNLLFSVKKSSLIQFKTKLDVFMASNTSEDVCDFRIDGSYYERFMRRICWKHQQYHCPNAQKAQCAECFAWERYIWGDCVS